MALGLDSTGLGSLLGTLGPQGIVGLLQAQQDQEQQALAAQATQAAQQSQQATQQYQQQAQAPPRSVGGAAFIPTLTSGVASVLSGNTAYQQQNAQSLAAQQNDLMEARRSTLIPLRDIQDQKAKAAEKLGDQAVAEKAR